MTLTTIVAILVFFTTGILLFAYASKKLYIFEQDRLKKYRDSQAQTRRPATS